MTAAAMNFKPYSKGSMVGFFDLRYHGMVVKGCRLMHGNAGLWIALLQRTVERDGETKYVPIVELTATEAEHVRRLVVADLRLQGHVADAGDGVQRQPHPRPRYRTPEDEGLSEYWTGAPGDIPS